MKKITKVSLAVLCLIGSMSFGQKKSNWAIAAVDGAAAVTAGADIIGISGGTAALTPLGWTITGIASAIAGAGASVLYADSKTVSTSTSDNRDNNQNYVGVEHNKIIVDYLQQIGNREVNNETYLEYINRNRADTYRYVSNFITKDYLENQKRDLETLNNEDDIIEWSVNKLPSDVDRSSFRGFLQQYRTITSKSDAVNFILEFENRTLKSDLRDESKEALKYYFSTLRNSTLLWE